MPQHNDVYKDKSPKSHTGKQIRHEDTLMDMKEERKSQGAVPVKQPGSHSHFSLLMAGKAINIPSRDIN